MTAVAVPTIVALRRGTLDFFPRLAERLAASGYRHQLTVSEAEAAARPVDPRGKPDSVSPAQLCRLLGVEATARCEVSAIVFPRISHAPGAFALRRLTAADVAAEIADMLFGVR